MKYIIGIISSMCLFLLIPSSVLAANYYVSTSGNDNNAGTSSDFPWQSISKVNNMMNSFLPGDTINFKKGDTWVANEGLTIPYLNITKSGTLTNPINFTAYGDGTNPTITNPSNTSGKKRGIAIVGSYINVSNFIVKDVTGSFADAVVVFGDNNVVRNTEIYNSTFGIDLQGHLNKAKNNYIHDCVMIHTADSGGAVGILIKNTNNEVSYNRVENCKYTSTQYGSDGGFVELYGTVDGSTIHHNWTYNNEGFMEVGSAGMTGTANNVTVSYNVAYRTGRFIGIHGSGEWGVSFDNWKVENNTIVEDQNHENTLYSMIYFQSTVQPTQYYLRNNIFYVNDVSYIASDGGGGFTHKNNIYYFASTTPRLGFTLDPSEKQSNPLFIDIAAPNFHLQQTSPAVDAGLDLGYNLDFDNQTVPFNVIPDIGGFEYHSLTSPSPSSSASPTPTPKPGDANGDGQVNEADYTIWLNHYPQQVGGGASVGDFDGSGWVNGIDYVIWLNNYGQ